MNETPKKIWVDELEWGFGIKPEWYNTQYYIRADLVDELVEALEYCIKQIPEFADVPGIKAALAKVRGEK